MDNEKMRKSALSGLCCGGQARHARLQDDGAVLPRVKQPHLVLEEALLCRTPVPTDQDNEKIDESRVSQESCT